MAKAGEVKVGDKVTTTAKKDMSGTSLASFVRETTYTVMSVSGNRVVIGTGSVVVAAVDISTIRVISGKAKPTKTETVKYKEQVSNSKAIEDGLLKLMSESVSQEWSKYTTRLFGLPHQLSHFCDYRTFSSVDRNKRYKISKDKLIGRTFITNICMEAPIVTFIPGKPLYLPASSKKQGIARGLLEAANHDLSTLNEALKTQSLHDKLRYYDFQQDYYNYMIYVNILCSTAAAFLELGNKELDGIPLTKYDWKNYRWNATGYSTAFGNILVGLGSKMKGAVNELLTKGASVLGIGKSNNNSNTKVTSYNERPEDDKDFGDALNSILTSTNYVQFYVDSSSGLSESAENSTAESKFEGMLQSGSDLSKEIQFVANSGGLDAKEFSNSLGEGIDVMKEMLVGEDYKGMGGIISRITSGLSNVVKGDTMIFPEVYQNSKYNKNYSIIVDLRTPYGNKFSYFINILVPLFHILALTVPKQSTANTYSSPFLVKAYYPGVFSCNLGIIQSIQIDKCPSGDGWTVDGYPSEVKVTINLVDLYSDLNITPGGDVVLFLSNSSLIEYIATSCGVNIVTPQLNKRVDMVVNTVKQSFDNIIDDTINMTVMDKAQNLIDSLLKL